MGQLETPEAIRESGIDLVSQFDDIKDLFKRVNQLKETKSKLHKDTCSQIKAAFNALVAKIRTRQETLISEASKRYRHDLANLTRAEFSLRKRIEDMTRLRKSLRASETLQERPSNNPSYVTQIRQEIDHEIEKLLNDGEVILSYYSYTVEFQDASPQELNFCSINERPIPGKLLSNLECPTATEKTRRHTVTEAPDMTILRPNSPLSHKESTDKTRRFTVIEPPDPRQLEINATPTLIPIEMNEDGEEKETQADKISPVDSSPVDNDVQTKPHTAVTQFRRLHSPRRNTFTERPTGRVSNLRKARSTDDLLFTTSHMSLAFTMSNEDLSNSDDANSQIHSNSDENITSLDITIPRLTFIISKIGSAPGEIMDPRDATFLPNGDICVAEYGNRRLQLFNQDGKSTLLMQHTIFRPNGVTMTRDGYIAVTDELEKNIKAFTRSGSPVCQFGTGYFKNLTSIKTTSKDLYVLIEGGGSMHPYVCIYDSMTGQKKRIGQAENGDYLLSNPSYVTTNSNDNIYICDGGLHCVWKFDSNGKLIKKLGSKGDGDGELNYPMGVCVDEMDNLFVADSANHRICQFDANGRFVKTVLDRTNGLKYPKVVTMKGSNMIVLQSTALMLFHLHV